MDTGRRQGRGRNTELRAAHPACRAGAENHRPICDGSSGSSTSMNPVVPALPARPKEHEPIDTTDRQLAKVNCAAANNRFVAELALAGSCRPSVYALAEMPRPGQIIGDYALTSLLGSGGTCEVFAATDTRSGRAVALKVLRAELLGHTDIEFRFLNEALPASLRAIRHPAIIEVYETSPPAFPFLFHAMELLHESLAQRLRFGPVPVLLSLRLAAQIADALATLHMHNVVHRDVKPSNILLTDEPDDWLRAKLSDFGLARLPASDTEAMPVSTAEGTRLGTPEYMPPEQWDDAGEAAGSADVYALGCSLYQLLMGQLPFRAESDAQLRRQHLLVAPPGLPPTIPQGLRQLVSAMMAKPAHRRPTAAEVAERLEQIARDMT